MSEFTDADFSDPIRRMSDGALARLHAINNGEIESMRVGDEHLSLITDRHESDIFQEVSYEVLTRAFIFDRVGDPIMQQDRLPPHLQGTLSGMLLTLADSQDSKQSRNITPLEFDAEYAAKLVADKWLLSTTERMNHQDFKFFTLDLGHVAFTSIFFAYDTDTQAWRLGYEMKRPFITYRAHPDFKGEIDIVDDEESDLVVL
ncbi:MAG: hypothetical protein WAO28_00995 [Candidatus Microsaccharimonas sp.]